MQISDFSLRNMKTFCAVVEHQGFGGAQAVLGMSQPAISMHIKDLETQLGFRLCQRGRGGFLLTEKGRIVYDKARQALGQLDHFGAELGELRQALVGTLRVGLVDSMLSETRLPMDQVFAAFNDAASEVALELRIGPPDELERDLLNNSLHLAVGPFHNFVAPLRYDTLHEERHSLYCGQGHALYDLPAASIDREDVARAAFVMRSYIGLKELQRLGDIDVRARVNNMEASAALILSGCYIGYLPDHYAGQWIAAGRLKAIDHLGLEWQSPFQVATRRSPTPTLMVQQFLDCLTAACITGLAKP